MTSSPRRVPGKLLRSTGVTVLFTALAAGASAGAQNSPPSGPPPPQEVRFTSGGTALAGLLRLPTGPGPHPAVVLIPGSLPTAKEDGRLASVAAGFVARGFAVLTTDSRGLGNSQGDFHSTSLEAHADDTVAAVDWLRQRADVRGDAVGLWGVSQGASWVGPLAARRAGVAFLIGVSGPVDSPAAFMHRFFANRLRSAHKLDEATVERAAKARALVWSYLATGKGFEEASAAVAALRQEPWYSVSGLPPAVRGPEELAGLPAPTRTFVAQRDFDPLAAIGRLPCPMLAVYGAADTMLPVAEQAEALRTLASRSHASIKVEVLAGLDHDLRAAGAADAPDAIDAQAVATMASWAATQVAHATRPMDGAAPLVIGETFTIDSKVLAETRRINVYLPPGYAESADARLPVLYMPDGGMAEDFLHVAGLVQVSVGNGTMRPFVLVGIENTQRRRDMTGPTQNEEDKKIAPVVGGSAAFRRFIRDELMPWIEARYRTTKERAIVGESAAGLFVVETLFLEPELFDTYIAIDPSLWWNDQKLLDAAPARLGAWPALSKTLYFASSGDGTVEIIERFADILRKHAPPSVHWYYAAMASEKHATIYHPAALEAFRALFKPAAAK